MNDIPWFGWVGIGATVVSLFWYLIMLKICEQRDRAEWRERHHTHPHDLTAYHDGGAPRG